jgi:hypothetical protein
VAENRSSICHILVSRARLHSGSNYYLSILRKIATYFSKHKETKNVDADQHSLPKMEYRERQTVSVNVNYHVYTSSGRVVFIKTLTPLRRGNSR